MTRDEEAKFRAELENAGEASVRADYYGGGGLATGGEDRRTVIRHWLREKERAREGREKKSIGFVQATFWLALATLIAAIAAVYLDWIHK